MSNRSAAGRSGRWWSASGFARNPTWQMAARKSAQHAHHAFAIAPTGGVLDHVSIAYVSGEHAEPLTRRRSEDKPPAVLKGDRRPSLPRTFAETPGRCYLHVSHPQHQQLQAKGSESSARAQVVAESRVQLLLFLSWLGMVPQPPQLAEQPRTSRSHRSRGVEARQSQQSAAGSPRAARSATRQTHPKGAPRTAWRTWQVFSKAASREEAIAALACLKGFYLNFYPAPMHRDSDDYLESWTIRLLLSLGSPPSANTQSAPTAQRQRRAEYEARWIFCVLPYWWVRRVGCGAEEALKEGRKAGVSPWRPTRHAWTARRPPVRAEAAVRPTIRPTRPRRGT